MEGCVLCSGRGVAYGEGWLLTEMQLFSGILFYIHIFSFPRMRFRADVCIHVVYNEMGRLFRVGNS